ncbi:MAG: LptF/LptG family permease [Alphaproteobacteria bacterium]|nr:LptF/LptG family permease [Alphaproteobacteria bacterium]
MSIINKYFSRQLITIFVMLLAVLAGLAWMVQIMSMMKFVLNYGVQVSSFIGLTALMIPFIIAIIIPFVTFIAIIFVYNKLIADNEVTVMASTGLAPRQIARPAMMFAVVMTLIHLGLNIFVVPSTQAKFYDTQWNLRYGLAHLKLQEAAFTELSSGLVVYVDKVSGYDLSQVMLSDMRNERAEMIIFAEKGKLVATQRGLSIVMTNGSVQGRGDMMVSGTFETFDMDLNVADKGGMTGYRVRSVSTGQLFQDVLDSPTAKRHRTVLTELATRLLEPFMNIILAALCLAILLRTSLLRRRASFAPAAAVASMAVVMAVFMSASNMMNSITDFGILSLGVLGTMMAVVFALYRK